MTTATKTALSARNLRKYYGKDTGLVRAVDGVDLDVEQGETVAIIGPSGCGKSTVLHLLSGLDRPSDGEVELAGRRLDKMSERQLARLRRDEVGVVFQSFHLIDELTAQENVELPALLAGQSPRLARRPRDRTARPCRSVRPGSPPSLSLVRWTVSTSGNCSGTRQRSRRRLRG